MLVEWLREMREVGDFLMALPQFLEEGFTFLDFLGLRLR
jgi:hypothetical protein